MAVSSPQMYAPAPLRISMSNENPCPRMSSPRKPAGARLGERVLEDRVRLRVLAAQVDEPVGAVGSVTRAMVIASMTAYGSPSRSTRSLNVPGSDSSALQIR